MNTFSRAMHTLATLAVVCASALLTDNALAQSASEERARPVSQLSIGAGVAYVPRYEGADSYRMRALPLINYRSGRMFAGTLGGVGYDFSPLAKLQFGPIVSFRFGRYECDSARLRGLGDIRRGADAGAFVRWEPQPLFLNATLKRGFGGELAGTQLNLDVGYGFTFGPDDRLVLDSSVEWTDSELMQAYFGVTSTQSLRSGLSQYRAQSGVRRFSAGTRWIHAYTRRWSSIVGVTAYRLGNPAAASPITQEPNGFVVTAGVSYRFR